MTAGNGYRRMRLRRADGQVYLDRWGMAWDRVGGVYLHRMAAPDPGEDLHDHPWAFRTLILWGGYVEERADVRDAPGYASSAGPGDPRGWTWSWLPGSFHAVRLDECHRITTLLRRTCWTLVVRGPRRRPWGFYLPSGYVSEAEYDRTQRRDLWNEDVRS